MKKINVLLSALAVGVSFMSSAQVTLVSPKDGEVVSQLYPAQLTYLNTPRPERDKYFTDQNFSTAMRKDGSAPKPILLSWQGDAQTYRVTVKRLPDGKEFYSLTVQTNCVKVDSLEIARTWEWTVTAGDESAKGTFKTEDKAPRLIRIKGVSNARDVGGRIGLGGRRIRQGLFYRTSGLNNNAPVEYYTAKEIKERYQAGKIKSFGHRGKELARKLKAGEKITDKDVERAKLVKRKCFAPGKKRLSEEERQRVLKFYGIKSDIDLRSDKECYGMTESPLGPTVTWNFVPYSGYTSAFKPKVQKEKDVKSYRLMTDANNYPLVVHCIGGADRTGTFCMLFEALLGVEEDELWKDYLTTGFKGGVSDERHMKLFTDTMNELKKLPGETLADKAESYFLACGLTKENVAFIRDFLLEK